MMKLWRLLICFVPLLAGCAMIQAITGAGSQPAITEAGVDGLTATTPVDSQQIAAALRHRYQLLEGMQTDNGKITRYIAARKAGKTALEISGSQQGISRILILDPDLSTADGIKVGTQFGEIYQQAYNHCQKDQQEPAAVICQAPDSQRLSYQFRGEWQGAESLIPSDDVLRHWTISKIIWQNR